MKTKNKKIFKIEMSKSKTKYNKDVTSIAIAGLMIAIVMLSAWITSSISFPKIPLIGGRPDFWYGISVVAIVFVPDWKYRILYILSLPFALMPSELRGAAGMYDYFLEWMCPMLALFFMIPLMQNKIMLLMQVFIVVSIYMSIKLLFSTYAGVEIYKVASWKASLIYNWPNTSLDWGISMIVAPLTLLKLIKIRK